MFFRDCILRILFCFRIIGQCMVFIEQHAVYASINRISLCHFNLIRKTDASQKLRIDLRYGIRNDQFDDSGKDWAVALFAKMSQYRNRQPVIFRRRFPFFYISSCISAAWSSASSAWSLYTWKVYLSSIWNLRCQYIKLRYLNLVFLAPLPFGKLRISADTITDNPAPLFGSNRWNLLIHDLPPYDG